MRKILISITTILLILILSSCTTNPDKKNDPIESKLGKRAYEHFVNISRIPRASGNMQGISTFLVSFAQENGLEVTQDSALNVLIKKSGSKGREAEPPVILQAHMDMVADKNQYVDHDFTTDPIIPIINGDWVTASKQTTLGADNGAGLSILLAILEADYLSHPPIEAIITTDEEIGMLGAAVFDVALLAGKRFINLDMESEGVFIVSCAGSAGVEVIVPIEYRHISAGFDSYVLSIKGLLGGHSGADIHLGRANANVLMAELLKEIAVVNFELSSINGGSARNAIPRESFATISFQETDFVAIDNIVKQTEILFKSTYSEDIELSVTLEKTSKADLVMTENNFQSLLKCILEIPNGVITMSSDIPGLVQTSNNLGVITTGDDAIILSNYPRSSSLEDLSDVLETINSISTSAGATISITGQVPPWPYKQISPLRDDLAQIYLDMFNKMPLVTAIHAGLECALFAGKMPDTEFISIGPDIEHAHSPDERLSLSSYYRVCEFVARLLEML